MVNIEKDCQELEIKECVEMLREHLTNTHEDILRLREMVDGSWQSSSSIEQFSVHMMSQMQKLEQENEELVKALVRAAKLQ